MKERGVSADSTIYNYTLVRRVNVRVSWQIGFLLVPAVFWILLVALYGREGGLAVLAGALAAPLLHVMLIDLYFKYTQKRTHTDWNMRWHPFWFGYRPSGYVSAQLFFRIHHHLAFVGAAVLSIGFTWMRPVVYAALLFTHLWLLAPVYLLLPRSRGLKKHVLLKLNEKDASFYLN